MTTSFNLKLKLGLNKIKREPHPSHQNKLTKIKSNNEILKTNKQGERARTSIVYVSLLKQLSLSVMGWKAIFGEGPLKGWSVVGQPSC